MFSWDYKPLKTGKSICFRKAEGVGRKAEGIKEGERNQ